MNWNKQLVKDVWERIGLGADYTWVPGPKAQAELRMIFPKLPADLFTGRPGEINRKLRQSLAPALRENNPSVTLPTARWIIARWGGIYANSDVTISEYVDGIGRCGAREVDAFVARAGTKGISSWSKLLAFADPSRYAVYDSRTAVALNCALAQCGSPWIFEMPPGRSDVIATATKALRTLHARRGNPRTDLGYGAYLDLLGEIVAVAGVAGPRDLLGAEMAIFVNAPEVARRFNAGDLSGHGRPRLAGGTVNA